MRHLFAHWLLGVVGDASNRCDTSSCSSSKELRKGSLRQLREFDRPTLHCPAKLLGDINDRQLCDGSQDARRLGNDEACRAGGRSNADRVGRAEFVNVSVFCRVQVKGDGKAALLCSRRGTKDGSVVAWRDDGERQWALCCEDWRGLGTTGGDSPPSFVWPVPIGADRSNVSSTKASMAGRLPPVPYLGARSQGDEPTGGFRVGRLTHRLPTGVTHTTKVNSLGGSRIRLGPVAKRRGRM